MLARRRDLLVVLAASALIAWDAAAAETIIRAGYADPVERYGHFAPGRPHEYARLTATTSTGRTLSLALPPDEVFEDVAPRLVRLADDAPVDLLAIVSRRDSGARLALIRLRGDELTLHAQSPPIGTPMRWLNPVGVADLDADGRAEIAAVITPHIGGVLKVYRERGGALVEIAALPGFSNHVNGSPELALSAPAPVAGRMRLLVPDTTRRHLRIVALERDRLVEVGRCALSAPVTGAIAPISSGEVSVGLQTGRRIVAVQTCVQ